MDLEEEEIHMLALLRKEIPKNKHLLKYWVHPLLCAGLQTVNPKRPAAALFHL